MGEGLKVGLDYAWRVLAGLAIWAWLMFALMGPVILHDEWHIKSAGHAALKEDGHG